MQTPAVHVYPGAALQSEPQPTTESQISLPSRILFGHFSHVLGAAVEQVQPPCSTSHHDEQPSPELLLPSSQVSPLSSTASPHVSIPAKQVSGPTGGFTLLVWIVHTKATSGVQSGPHPSPATRLPSSHASAPSRIPFPQSEQMDGQVPVQTHAGSGAHRDEHPSPLTLFPSSQTSKVESTLPFPQTGHGVVVALHCKQTLGLLRLHENPASKVHVAEQPSPPTWLPSSHVSTPSRVPEPHAEEAPEGQIEPGGHGTHVALDAPPPE